MIYREVHILHTRLAHVACMCLSGVVYLNLCVSCIGEKVYHHYNHTPIAGWEKVDTLIFDVPKLSETGIYGTDIGLRINNYYPFMSITLIVETTAYPSHKQWRDTMTCKLMDTQGHSKGQGVSYYQYHYPVSQLLLHQNDSLHITVRHDMEREILPGIADIGIAVNKLK